jgi:glycosyltransferase involved in cell wall biosynthesis
LVEWDEQIKGHLFWVWGGEEGFFKRGKEGMLVITDRRLAFIIKTDMTYKMHQTHSIRQLKRFEADEDIFRPAEGYNLEHLKKDLAKSPDNLQIPFVQILDIISEEKDWGTLLKVKVNLGYKAKVFKFSIVKGWVKYPAKDPLEFQRMDWRPLINLVKMSI